jgi:hypothetical protein
MARRFGIEPASAIAQAQRDQTTGASEPFQPLPKPTGAPPYRLALPTVAARAARARLG